MLIRRSEDWTRQPQYPADIDRSNPIFRYSVQGFVNAGMFPTDSRYPLIFNSTKKQLSQIGIGALVTGGSGYASENTTATADPFTLLVYCIPNTSSAHALLTTAEFPGSGTLDRSLFIGSAGGVNGYIYDGAPKNCNSGTSITVGVPMLAALTSDGSKITAYHNGIAGSPVTTTNTGYAGYSTPELVCGFGGGSVNGGGQSLSSNTTIFYALKINGALSEREIKEISARPGQIFASKRRTLFVPSWAGGSISASGGDTAAGSASLSAQVALAAVGVANAAGVGNLAASIPLSAVGFGVAGGASDAKATVTISAAGLAQAAGQAGLSAAVLLQAAGAAQAAGNASLTGGAPGSLAAAGQATAQGNAVLTVTVRLQAAGAAQAGGAAAGSAQAPGALSAAGQAAASGFAQWSALINLTAAGFVQAMGQGSLAITVPLSAQGAATAQGLALASLGGTLQPRRLVAEAPRRIRRLATGAQRLITLQHGARHV